MIVHPQCALCAEEKPFEIRAFRQTDRPRRAISVGITLSLFTGMMPKRSRKRESRRTKNDVFVVDFEKNSRRRKTNRDIDVKSIRAHRDSFSDWARSRVVIDELSKYIIMSLESRAVSRENPILYLSLPKFYCNKVSSAVTYTRSIERSNLKYQIFSV